jgi:hypothetical protein
MGKVKIKYYSVRKGRGYWISTIDQEGAGARPPFDHPLRSRRSSGMGDCQRVERTLAIGASRTRALTEEHLAEGSVGEGFEKFRRSQTWKDKKRRTREYWDRCWRHVASIFGDVSPRTIMFEHLDACTTV